MKITRTTTDTHRSGSHRNDARGLRLLVGDRRRRRDVDEIRLGYFANVTHAPALVGVAEGLFDDALGDVDLKTEIFNAGPAAIEALSAGAIDAAYIGPNPSINTFIQSGGESAHIIAGATSGGAALVVRDGIDSPEDLDGTNPRLPRSSATRRTSRCAAGSPTRASRPRLSGGGDVTITPTENAQTLTLFQHGQLDGAWLPEPWVSRLVVEAGAHVLVDEKDLWVDGALPHHRAAGARGVRRAASRRRRGAARGAHRRRDLDRRQRRATPRPSSTTRSSRRPARGSRTRCSPAPWRT